MFELLLMEVGCHTGYIIITMIIKSNLFCTHITKWA